MEQLVGERLSRVCIKMSERHEKSLSYAIDTLLSKDVVSNVDSIYLYGSVARGEATFHSDVDLLVVVKEDTSPAFMRKIRSEVNSGDYTLPEVDTHFTKDKSLSNLCYQFAKNVRKDGILLWERN